MQPKPQTMSNPQRHGSRKRDYQGVIMKPERTQNKSAGSTKRPMDAGMIDNKVAERMGFEGNFRVRMSLNFNN
jgi:hypothetical protein